MSVIFSGIQPTGSLHLGNYLGAIKPWKDYIKSSPENKFIFSIVDMHAITVFQEKGVLTNSILQTFATYLACGINPSNNVHIFLQSKVKEHTELAWILACHTPLGWLDRMTQYKDKTKENKERECLGLYAYPCLMAADILLYDTNFVPVGADQSQHIELARDIALRINRLYEEQVFLIPEIKLSPFKRVMSLKDGSKKMSKSDTSPHSRLNLTDTADEISFKISKATTGSHDSLEALNLLTIYKEISGKDYLYDGEIRFSDFKKELIEYLVGEITPISSKINELMKDLEALNKMLLECTKPISFLAEEKMKRIKPILGL
jgi:tryptophanyl-tRNA synthetase